MGKSKKRVQPNKKRNCSRVSKVLDWFDIPERYQRDKKGFIFHTCVTILTVLFAVLLLLPIFRAFRATVAFGILRSIFLCAIPLYFAWLSNHKPDSRSAKVALSILSVVYILPLFIKQEQISLLIDIVICWGVCIYTVWLFVFREEQYPALTWNITVYAFVIALKGLTDYSFVENPNGLNFWVISLILGIVSAIVCAILLFTKVIHLYDDRISEQIGVIICVAFAMFFIVLTTAAHLNYALDPNPSEEATVIITQKEISGSKSQDYELFFWYDGEERTIEVGRDEYYSYAIGDRFEIEICQGAFGKAFIKQK